jgi:hypothetical protein
MVGELGHFPFLNELSFFRGNQFRSSSFMQHDTSLFGKVYNMSIEFIQKSIQIIRQGIPEEIQK